VRNAFESLRLAAKKLDQARDDEHHAERQLDRAKAKLAKAKREYDEAMESLHAKLT
jgi:hypothetical protein